MVELIITETGFPKSRPVLKEFQDSFLVPINELLRTLPGNRILSGVESSAGGTVISAGILLYKGKLWTLEGYEGPALIDPMISFFETIETMSFNVNTQANPIYENRPGKIVRTAKMGDHVGATHQTYRSSFLRGRKNLEYLKAGSIFVGVIVNDVTTATYHVDFGENIETKDYQVLGNFRPADSEANFSRAFTWDINNRSRSGFDVLINKVESSSVPLLFDYTVIPINRESLVETANP